MGVAGPAIKVALGVDNIQIGLMLLGAGIASILGLSLATVVLARFGARTGMLGAILVFAVGVAVIGIGTDVAHSLVVVVARARAVRASATARSTS